MTVVTWDGKTLAADRRVCNNGMKFQVTKIRRIGNLLIGMAGSSDFAQEMFAWFENGRNPAEFPAFQRTDEFVAIIVIDDENKIWRYERSPYPILVEEKRHAIGSGREYALAAMHCGKDAMQAVLVASYFDAACGSGVDALSW